MQPRQATAVAHPNIALIKYWGNLDAELRLPANGSISLTLAGMRTQTTVVFDSSLKQDQIIIDGASGADPRVQGLLDLVRDLASLQSGARVDSASDFPAGAGLAASASAFAALALAASRAAGMELSAQALSRLARRGSGSAARSVLGGYVELLAGDTDQDSYAQTIAAADHWDLVDLAAVVSRSPKPVGSTAGHAAADSSPIQAARVADAPRRLAICREAILARDFEQLAAVAEQDSDLMHAVMMTSSPPLHYWHPATLEVMAAVREMRAAGTAVFYTVDAGPNVHCLCLPGDEAAVRSALSGLQGVQQVFRGTPGGGARLLQVED